MSWFIIISLAAVIWCGCGYLAFSRTTVRTVVKLRDRGDSSQRHIWTWKYPRWRSWALLGMVVIPPLTLWVLMAWPTGMDNRPDQQSGLLDLSTVRPASATATKTPQPQPTLTPTPSPVSPAATPTHFSSTVTMTSVPTAIPPLQATLTPTASPTRVTPTPVPSATPTGTPTLKVATEPPPTATPTATPSVTATGLPPSTPLPLEPPAPLEPLLGREYSNPILFRWRGILNTGRAYRVNAYHPQSGTLLQSEPLTRETWTAQLPAQLFGEWRWQVAVVMQGRVEASSPEWMFWFNPFPGTKHPTATPTPTPTLTQPSHRRPRGHQPESIGALSN